MIKISCSILEQVRKAPDLHAKSIATIDKPKTGGSYGMFACWQDTVKLVHTGELSVSQAIKELENKFLRFDDNVKNKAKQTYLVDSLPKYIAAYNKQKFEFIDSKHQMKWDIVEGVRLTGHTPWVVFNGKDYYAFLFIETELDWKNQLRFPLFQQYLIDHHIACELQEMNVGTYCLETGKFDFACYSKKEIASWVTETGRIFQTVLHEYRKFKK
jgi:hypothetical protein